MQVIQKALLKSLDNFEKPESVQGLLNSIYHINDAKNVMIHQITKPILSEEITRKYNESKEKISEMITQETDNYKIRRLNTITQGFDNLYRFAQQGKLLTKVEFPGSNLINEKVPEPFTFMAGRVKQIQYEGNVIECKGEFKPVVKSNLLKKLNVSVTGQISNNLKADMNKLAEIRKGAKAEFNEGVKKLRHELNIRRKIYKIRFYNRWFTTMIVLLISFIMYRFLYRYFSIIRRKALPKKTTYDVYFATNTTSLVFRWLTLLVVFLGLLGLIVNAIYAVITGGVSHFIPLPPIFHGITFIYKILHPVVMAISTIVASWLFVLLAEEICFISNLYHLVFEKVYGKLEK